MENYNNNENNYYEKASQIVCYLSKREVNWFLFLFNDEKSFIKTSLSKPPPYPLFFYKNYLINFHEDKKRNMLLKNFIWLLENLSLEEVKRILKTRENLIAEKDLIWLKDNLKAQYYVINKLKIYEAFSHKSIYPVNVEDLFYNILFYIDNQWVITGREIRLSITIQGEPYVMYAQIIWQIFDLMRDIRSEYFKIHKNFVLDWIDDKNKMQVTWAMEYIRNTHQDLLNSIEGKPRKHPRVKESSSSKAINNEETSKFIPKIELGIPQEEIIEDYKKYTEYILNGESFFLQTTSQHRVELIEFYVEFIAFIDLNTANNYFSHRNDYMKSFRAAWNSKVYRDNKKAKLKKFDLPKEAKAKFRKLSKAYNVTEIDILIEKINDEYDALIQIN